MTSNPMTNRGAPALDNSDWQVPTHEVALYAAKAHKYALVIPVINEGERIRGQLTRIRDADLPVDVIVADGGSSDGSLDPEFVGPIGVRAVLTKTGPGKLSAQLRMAYAWCLQEGYDGVVTIDGNGKDGVEAVAHFVAKLEAGCDYVQGSRYLPGGEAENTPLERTIANRLIHAPILSLAGRHIFTDTTNGFRGYSARYLTHPDVRPFRDEFEVYNLLFYLTVRAGQLGLKVGHVPVIRRYPHDGKVPTKIGGLGSKLALLGETVVAATGGHTPDRTAIKRGSLAWPALVASLVLLPLLLTIAAAPNYSPDSWALYELSQTVFSDFYRFSHFRSYSGISEYSSAFAPLWPTLIALVDGALATGARTGLYLAFASYFAFALVSEHIGRRISGTRWIGLAGALILLLGHNMVWDELGAGRTIPLQLLIYALVLSGLLTGKIMGLMRAGAVGFLAGLAVMNRFDAVLLPIFTAAMLLWITRKPLHLVAALFASLIAVSPWIAYSLATFGSLFATDNSGVATALQTGAFVTDWWPQPQPNWSDDPAAWSLKVIGNVGLWINNAGALLITPLGASVAMAMAFLGAVQLLCSKAPSRADKRKPRLAEPFLILALFTLVLTAMMLPQIITGYLEYRYYSALLWAVFLSAALWQIGRAKSERQRQFFSSCLAGIIGLWVLGFAAVQIAGSANPEDATTQNWAQFDEPSDVSNLRQCLGENSKARVLVRGDDLFAAKAGATGSLRTMMEPSNMAQGRLDRAGQALFMAQWDVEYVLLRGAELDIPPTLRQGFASVPDCDLALFKRAG